MKQTRCSRTCSSAGWTKQEGTQERHHLADLTGSRWNVKKACIYIGAVANQELAEVNFGKHCSTFSGHQSLAPSALADLAQFRGRLWRHHACDDVLRAIRQSPRISQGTYARFPRDNLAFVSNQGTSLSLRECFSGKRSPDGPR